MVKSVGIDLAGTGEHKVRCLDERAQLFCDINAYCPVNEYHGARSCFSQFSGY